VTFYAHEYRENVTDIIAEDRSGYSRVDFARVLASWTVHDCFGGAFSVKGLGQVDPGVIQLGKRRNRGQIFLATFPSGSNAQNHYGLFKVTSLNAHRFFK